MAGADLALEGGTREPFLATFSGFVLLGVLFVVIDGTYPELRRLDALIAQTDDAAATSDVNAVIGDKAAFVAAWQGEEKNLRGSSGLYAAIVNVEEELNARRPDNDMIRTRLGELAAA